MFGLFARFRAKAQESMSAQREFVYALDRAINVTVSVTAPTAQEALVLLRETHGYRALDNAFLIDVR